MLSKQTTSQLQDFSSMVVERNRKHNLTGYKDPELFFKQQVLDCVKAYEIIKDKVGLQVVDCGSGAGLPGVVWAIINPFLFVLSADSNLKKINFQKFVINKYGIKNVLPIHTRIEDIRLSKKHTLVFKAFGEIRKALKLTNALDNVERFVFLKKDDAKAKEELHAAAPLIYDYNINRYKAPTGPMLALEIYGSKDCNN